MFRLRSCLAGLLCLAALLAAVCPTFALAAQPRTVRVGYFAFPGYHELLQSESGPVGSGYGFDFLQLLRRYTNLNYEYVGYEDGWQDMQQMLRDGEIDLVTSAHTAQILRMKHAFRSSRMCDVSQRRWLH